MIYMIGNAHIDPIWLWQWQEGYQEVKATFQSALDRMDESEDFVFTAACAEYYRWVEESCPPMFEKIRARVAEGRWRIVGGMWIQPDCNMPSGEAFARHFLYSQRYFKEKFGVTVRTGYNVDSFGHSAMLPALLKRGGIENYVFLRPDSFENSKLPGPLFRWFAPDGSSVTAFRIIDGYGSRYGSVQEDVAAALAEEKRTGFPIMCFYGVGNHGGGPTIQNIASIHEYQKHGEKGEEVIFSDPDAYFEAVKAQGLKLPEWRTELQHHASGCYSATSLIKHLNRVTENALIRSEIFAALSARLTGHKPDSLRQGWYNLMFNQFHDVLCGCSIREAYEDARVQLDEARSIAARAENAALQKISWAVDTVGGIPGRLRSKESHFRLWELDGLGTPVVVFNPHPFTAKAQIQVYGAVKYAADESDVETPIQTVRASRTNGEDKWDSLFVAEVPPMGYRLYWIYLDEKGRASHERDRALRTPDDNDAAAVAASGLTITETSIGNRHLSARFDPKTGALVSLMRRDSGRETLSALALPRLVDIEHADTWAHRVFTFDRLREGFENARFEILERGPVRAKLRVTTTACASTLVQDFILDADADQLEVEARLDMREKFRMLKLCFPVAAQSPKAHAEISYGVIERECDGCEETGHRWMQLGGETGGLAVLNDGKYSFSAAGNELRLTVANTSIYADHFGQRNRDDRCVHADMGAQEFRYALVPHDGSWTKAGLARRGELFNRPLTSIVEAYHEGPLPARYEGLSVEPSNVSVGALKRAEDGGGWILRLNETVGAETDASVKAPMLGRDLKLHLAPLEIQSIFIPDDAGAPVREVLFTEWER